MWRTCCKDLTSGRMQLHGWAARQIAKTFARRISPLTYVRGSLPPVLTIHGDAKVVPFSHAIRLRDALNKAGVRNRLLVPVEITETFSRRTRLA